MCNAWNHPDGCECGFGPPYNGSIADFFSRHVGPGGGSPNLAGAGEYSRRLAEAIENDEQATSLAASVFWQSYIGSSQFGRLQERIAPSARDIEIYIVRHDGAFGKQFPRHDLLVLDPGLPRDGMIVEKVEVKPDDLRIGWFNFYRDNLKTSRSVETVLKGAFNYLKLPEVAVEAMGVQPFTVMILPPPRKIMTCAAWSEVPRVPSPAWRVASQLSAGSYATVGVVATDQVGTIGITTALHAVEQHRHRVFVNGTQGVVIGHPDPLTDSCFIEMAIPDRDHLPTSKGPLVGQTPGHYETLWFDGATQRKTTMMIAFTPELPFWTPGLGVQSRILTAPVTEKGDSGAALINSDGYVVGFAFYRTGFKSRIPHSAWIWAESVFVTHRLVAQ